MMIKTILLLVLATVVCAAPEARIVGGRDVDIAKHPYLVSIRYRSTPNDPYIHKCAGAIYSKRAVITGAQCVVDIKDGEKVMIVAGANNRLGYDGMPYPALKWIHHASYSEWTVDYDIAVIIIDDVFDFNHPLIKPIEIRESRPANGRLVTVTGWGYEAENGPSTKGLSEVEVPVVGNDQCGSLHGAGEITERMICAGYLSGGKDSCHGDTGGPLVYNMELVGLVSWGRGCARPNLPGVYTYVASLKKWVDDTISANL
ncbi:trypsin eta-like [Musca vetustissima]|uniref:trypsin eta-like n=1 Tax=Musca vetustissima TaxID=27455 RepID=UPI002AB6BB2B|nr:trypsin eta-like [Musca vetustissima]